MIIPKVLGESVPQINFLGKKFLMDIPSSPTNSQFPTSSSQLPVPNFPPLFPDALLHQINQPTDQLVDELIDQLTDQLSLLLTPTVFNSPAFHDI